MNKENEFNKYIKDKFIERYKELSPKYDDFIKCNKMFPRKSIRVNTLKISIKDLKNRLGKEWTLTQIPWCKEGFWIDHIDGRRDIGNLLEHTLGYIYVQDASSMIPPIVLDPQPGELVLDMCAAPGSKTTQMGQYMENKGLIVANDYKGIRLASLGININRCGIHNTILTLMHGHKFKDMKFDRILLDAPCSGTGTINKSFKILKEWSPGGVRRLAATQKQLLKTAIGVLKSGGTMVFSTCSCEYEENEANVEYVLEHFPEMKLESIELNINRSKPISDNKEVQDKVLRIWNYDNNTEGFFVSKFKKD